jgi:riboflavin synthase
MFTGIVETKGKIIEVEKTSNGKNFWIEAFFENNDLKIGDSISVNGACQTIVELKNNNTIFKIYSSFKTLELTNLDVLNQSNHVNLERAMLITTRLSGHIVQGHIDGMGKIKRADFEDNGKVKIFHIEIPSVFRKYIIPKGSITIDGISLTIVSIEQTTIELILIPETIQKTIADNWKVNDLVNLEFDLIAKYIENFSL